MALADTGASHCFMDLNFALENNFVLRPTNTSVTLADGSDTRVVHQTTPVALRLGKHFSSPSFYVIDMRQEYDIILGDDWLSYYDAVLHVRDKFCILRRHGSYHVFRSVASPVKRPQPHSPFLNAAQVARLYRTSENVRAFQVAVRETSDQSKHSKPSPTVQQLLHEYEDITQPRTSLPPARNIAHTIPLEPGHKPPFRPIYRLSPVEL